MSVMSLMAEDAETCQSEDAARLLALWEARRAGQPLPRFEEIGFKALDPWLDRVALIRTDFRAQEFSFHFVGDLAERCFGGNVAGASAISALVRQEHVSLVRCLDAVQSRRRPIHSIIPHAGFPGMGVPGMGFAGAGLSIPGLFRSALPEPGPFGPHGTLERLFLPCAEGTSVSAVILFLQPGGADRPSRYAVL